MRVFIEIGGRGEYRGGKKRREWGRVCADRRVLFGEGLRRVFAIFFVKVRFL